TAALFWAQVFTMPRFRRNASQKTGKRGIFWDFSALWRGGAGGAVVSGQRLITDIFYPQMAQIGADFLRVGCLL
ncbi:MAG: hypothetical protein ACOX9E_11430, partial [Lentisphaeria bacterium]